MMSRALNKAYTMPHVHDIQHFLAAGKGRGDNDMTNKIRENVILNYDKCYIYKDDDEYGKHWTGFIDNLHTTLRALCEVPHQDIHIDAMGGMKNNYDFNVSFIGLNQEFITKKKLEFKHNNSKVSKLPQFLELFDKDCIDKFDMCDERYASFYYDNWIDKYLAIDNDATVIVLKPDKVTYLKHVSDITYKHPFYNALYLSKAKHLKEKRKLVQDSIHQYLEKYIDPTSLSSSFNFDKVAQKIKESHTDKVYLMWDCSKFHTQVINVADIQIKKIIKFDKLCFDVEVEHFEYNIRIRLNWGNNAGIANPRWKYSFIHK